MNRPKISKELTLTKIKSMIQEDYEIRNGCNYFSISTNCRLTTKRIIVPAKYSSCTHPHCFDLEGFIRLVRTSTSRGFSFNKCPICGNEVVFTDLAVDELFTNLLHCRDKNGMKMDSSTSKVKIYEYGEWEWERNDKNNEVIENIEVDSNDSKSSSSDADSESSLGISNSEGSPSGNSDSDSGDSASSVDSILHNERVGVLVQIDDDSDIGGGGPRIITLDDNDDVIVL